MSNFAANQSSKSVWLTEEMRKKAKQVFSSPGFAVQSKLECVLVSFCFLWHACACDAGNPGCSGCSSLILCPFVDENCHFKCKWCLKDEVKHVLAESGEEEPKRCLHKFCHCAFCYDASNETGTSKCSTASSGCCVCVVCPRAGNATGNLCEAGNLCEERWCFFACYVNDDAQSMDRVQPTGTKKYSTFSDVRVQTMSHMLVYFACATHIHFTGYFTSTHSRLVQCLS